MTNSPHADIPWAEQTLEQLEAERAHFAGIADQNRGAALHASHAFVSTIDAWIARRQRKAA
jgi:hypothetical protein